MIFSNQEINFVVEKRLFETIKPISIDFGRTLFGQEDFKINANLPRFGGGGCCS
jgi:hypothetical protein